MLDATLLFPGSSQLQSPITHPFFDYKDSKSPWKQRTDGFDAGAKMLLEIAGNMPLQALFGLHNLAKPEDPFLKNKAYHVCNNRVFCKSDLRTVELRDLIIFLRKVRAVKMLALATKNGRKPQDVCPGDYFITDVFDGDLMMISKIN